MKTRSNVNLILVGAAAIVVMAFIILSLMPKRTQAPSPASVAGVLHDENSSVYTHPLVGFTMRMPEGFTQEEYDNAVIFYPPQTEAVGMGPVNFIYATVVDLSKDDGGYNYNDEVVEKLLAFESHGESVNVSEDIPTMMEWFDYTYSENLLIDAKTFKLFENYKPWEFPLGVTESRALYQEGNTVILLGYYTGGAESGSLDPRIARAVIESFKE